MSRASGEAQARLAVIAAAVREERAAGVQWKVLVKRYGLCRDRLHKLKCSRKKPRSI